MTQRATFIVCLAFSSMAHGAVHAADLGGLRVPGGLDRIDGYRS
jgi:hypothetical protein